MASQPDQRLSNHQQRVVDVNSNSTFSKIILPAFKDIWDFQNKYNSVGVVDALKKASTEFNGHFSLISDCYKQHGNKSSTAITVYTLQSYVYPKMNEALRNDQEKTLTLFAPYIYQLINGLNAEKNYYGTVYRGIKLPQNLISHYAKDTVFFWPGFTSSTQSKHVATNWAGSNCLFEITIPKRFAYSCANIDHLSAYKAEKEVLIQPYSCYRVLENKYSTQHNKNIIKLIIEATCYNLSGIWCCNDTEHSVNNAGIYFVAQYGQNVYWFGKKDKAYWDFTNVGYGVISNDDDDEKNNEDDVLAINWCDLPIANDNYCGKLKLKISSDYQTMTKIYDSNGVFWGNQWKKKSNIYLDTFELNINDIKWKSSDQYSGLWKGNYGGLYIVSTATMNNVNHICWIGYDPNGRWAHVAFGVIQNNKIWVDWGDLLLGLDRYHGKLECEIQSRNKIIMKKSTPAGIFLTQYITKSN